MQLKKIDIDLPDICYLCIYVYGILASSYIIYGQIKFGNIWGVLFGVAIWLSSLSLIYRSLSNKNQVKQKRAGEQQKEAGQQKGDIGVTLDKLPPSDGPQRE